MLNFQRMIVIFPCIYPVIVFPEFELVVNFFRTLMLDTE